MDKEFIKKYHLEEAQKRFQQISEYTFITKPVLGEDDDIQDDGQQSQQDNIQQGNQMNNDEQPSSEPISNAPSQPPQDGNNGTIPPSQIDSANNGGEENVPPSPQLLNNDESTDGEESENQGDDEETTEQPGDKVIDVDDLTKAQEVSDIKIDGVSDKLQTLLNVTNRFIAAVDQNNKKIDDLKTEFEKRNPSEEERINLRSQASSPYSETPREYWDNKKKNDPNYNIIYNNDVDPDKEDKEYVIRKGDIDGNTNDMALAKSLDYPTKLDDFINF